MKGLTVVAKHHDGFCLWPTKTTEHNITKSPFRGGKGDYVREMCGACAHAGLKFGVYCSPWDRNNAEYARPGYVKTFHEQVRELTDSRPLPDEALCAVLWEYKDRAKKGYDLTEKFFALMRRKFPQYVIKGPERAGKDILLGGVFKNYPNPPRRPSPTSRTSCWTLRLDGAPSCRNSIVLWNM